MEQIISNGVGLCNSVDIVDPEICEMIVPIYAVRFIIQMLVRIFKIYIYKRACMYSIHCIT